MRKHIVLILVAIMLACSTAFAGAGKFRETACERFLGIWVAEDLALEIWQADEAWQCRAVITDGNEEIGIWEYHVCVYDEVKDTLRCCGVTRTRERFDSVLDVIDELDWSMDDMSLAELRLLEDGLLFIDDELDAPVVLTRLSEAEGTERNEALAFVGLWNADSATLRAEDRGICYRFTVTVSIDDKTDSQWAYICLYDPDSGRMASVNISPRTVITRMANGDTVEVEEDFSPSNAEFILEEGNRLIWKDMAGNETVGFKRIVN